MAFIKKSFTLIELLVVVVIIGVLAAALIPRLQDAAKRTRDAIRHKDIKVAADALGIYYLDEKKMPMTTETECQAWSWQWNPSRGNLCWVYGDTFLKLLVPKYLTTVLKDPLPSNPQYRAVFGDSYMRGSAFDGWDNLENCNMPWGRGKFRYIVQLSYYPEILRQNDRVRACPNWMARDITLSSSFHEGHIRFWPYPTSWLSQTVRKDIVQPLWFWKDDVAPKDIPQKRRMRWMFLFDGQNFYFGEPNVRHLVNDKWYRDSSKQKYCKKADTEVCGNNDGYDY